ncbi:MAG: hypothetical protein AAF515_05605 [Pseudomonadota bacterium]
MNIWNWVDATHTELVDGESRLASMLYDIPHYTCNNEHERTEALLPEAIASARRLELPWVELFFRHWRLQSRVLHRSEAKQNLLEAVELLDFAHQSDTEDCPQSICVVQDLAICYALTDGPGYAEERLDVAAEALSKITPDWSCFVCITTELVNALLDQGNYSEALEELQRAQHRLRKTEGKLKLQAARALLALGDPEAAFREVESAGDNPGAGDDYVEEKALHRAWCLAALGRSREAEAELPDLKTVLKTAAHYIYWLETAELLVAAEHWRNDFELNETVSKMAETLEQFGCYRRAFRFRCAQARFALDRSRPAIARLAWERLATLVDNLAKPLDAPDIRLRLREQIESQPEPAPLPDADTPEQLAKIVDDLYDAEEYELVLEHYTRAAQQWRSDFCVQTGLARALEVNGWSAEALSVAFECKDRFPDNEQALLRWGFLLLDNDLSDELLAAYSNRSQDHPHLEVGWHWLAAHAYRRNQALDACVQALTQVLEGNSDARNARIMRAQLHKEAQRLEAALDDLNYVDGIDRERPASAVEAAAKDSLLWERLELSCRLKRWRAAREIANELEFELADADPDSPIEEAWEECWIRITDPHENERFVLAQRTGPVTARLVQIPPPHHVRRLHDVVFFDPRPLNDVRLEETEGSANEHQRSEYAFVDLLSAGE